MTSDPSSAKPDAVSTLDLPIPPGPWTADAWLIERPIRLVTSGTSTCVIERCELPAGTAEGDRPHETHAMCVAHRRRFAKRSAKLLLAEFIAEQASARPVRKSPTGPSTRQPFFAPINFALVGPQLAHELRYITATKIRRAHWGTGDYVHCLLSAALHYGQLRTLTSLLAEPVDDLVADVRRRRFARSTGESATHYYLLEQALPSMVKTLVSSRIDPWESDTWHPADLGISLSAARGRAAIHWAGVRCSWLRVGLKQLVRAHLQAGTRQFRSIDLYIRGGRLFSCFLEEEAGPLEPAALTRSVFLDFVSWARSGARVQTDLSAINTLARLLIELRARGIVPELPETTFLLRGENPVPKIRQPRPFPADIIERVDRMISEDPFLPDDVRLLLRVFRATGPRASEALLMPRDCVRYVDKRGYSLEYFMAKTQNWRRIPLPERLGRDLAAQAQRVADSHGPDCPWLFPYLGLTPRTTTMLTAAGTPPWSYDAFTGVVWSAFKHNGITKSSITGEVLKGPHLHRFRHTVATGLLNEGWSQYEVQQFLGHRSPTMMQAYAEIHEDRLRDKYVEFVEHAIDVSGQRQQTAVSAAGVERMRDRMIRSTLPNGYCTLPEKQTCDFVPTPCLSCKPFFRTTPTFLPIHIRQRDEALRELDLAKSDGRERAVAAHQMTVDRLGLIIAGLEAETAALRTEGAS